MFYILFYWKNECGCQKKDGFSSRSLAWDWIKPNLDNIEWYSIEEDKE